jgi:hypothetical protein
MTLLSDTEIITIGIRYGIEVNPENVTQYKLCQIISALEQNDPELLQIIEKNAERAKQN